MFSCHLDFLLFSRVQSLFFYLSPVTRFSPVLWVWKTLLPFNQQAKSCCFIGEKGLEKYTVFINKVIHIFWRCFSSKNKLFPFFPPDAGSGSGDGGRICLFIYLKTFMWILFMDIYLCVGHYKYLRWIHILHSRKGKTKKIILHTK